MAGATSEAVVVIDAYTWETPIPGTSPVQKSHNRAWRGETIHVTDEEFGRVPGALARPADAAAAIEADNREATEPLPAGAEGDEVLATYDAAELVAYVNQFAGERERVFTLEQARTASKQRATVLKAAGPAEPVGPTA